MRQGVRFVVVGGYNTMFGVAVFVALDLLLAAYIGHYLVLTIATVIGVANSHATQRRFVWHSSDTYLHELGRFSVVYAGFFFVNLGLLYVAHSILGATRDPSSDRDHRDRGRGLVPDPSRVDVRFDAADCGSVHRKPILRSLAQSISDAP